MQRAATGIGMGRGAASRIPASAPAPSGGSDWGQLVRGDLYRCAGIDLPHATDGTSSPATSWSEAAAGGTATQGFGLNLIAYPEVMPFAGTIDRLGMFAEGGGGANFKLWVAAFANTTVNGECHPGALLALFEHQGAGFDGEVFRVGAVSVPVTKGAVVWIGFQPKTSAAQCGWRSADVFRTALGLVVPATLSGGLVQKGYIGIRTSAAPAYDPTITTFPTVGTQLLPNGLDTVGGSAANIRMRPALYWRLART